MKGIKTVDIVKDFGGLKRKLGSLSGLFNEQVKWDYKFKVSGVDYEFFYSSKSIKSSVIEYLFSYLLKGAKDKSLSLDCLPNGEWFEIPRSAWENYEKNVLSIFPKVVLKKDIVFLSSRLDSLAVKKFGSSFFIKGTVKGLIKE